jgi:hypothetical protein
VRFSLFASLPVALSLTPLLAVPSAAQTTLPTEPALTASAATLPDAPSRVRLPASGYLNSPSLRQAPAQTTPSQQSTSSDQAPQDVVQQRVAECQKLPADQQKACIKAAADLQVKSEEKQRNLFILPAFNTVIAGVSPPLTPGQKWDLVYHTAKDPYTFAIAFVVTGFGEIEDNSNYGWGPSGYFKDVGAAYLDNVDGAVIGNAILPILLHQDPRYFRLGHGSIVRRILNAAGSTVIARGDNGKTEFNFSNVAGNFLSGAISNAYYPADKRGVGLTVGNAITVTAEGAVGAQLLEFGPDINALIARQRARHLAKLAARNGTATPATTPPTPPPAKPE